MCQAVKYHTVMGAVVTCVPHDHPPFYMSCPIMVHDERNSVKLRTCNKKAFQLPNEDGWFCNADHRCTELDVRWILHMSIADHSGKLDISCFDDIAIKVLSRTASEAAELWHARDRDQTAVTEWENLFRSPLQKRWRMCLKSKKELWNDEGHLRVTAVGCVPMDN